jgi:hypothetical protein
MTNAQIIQYLDGLEIVEALWWYIENNNESMSEVFFYLRERYQCDC